MAKTEAETGAQDARQAILEALRDPDVALQVVRAASQTAEGRSLLNIPAGKGPPSGEYHRDYHAEPALRVFGGVEVEHAAGFVPLPPNWVPRYVAADGGTTDDPALATVDAKGKQVKTADYKHWLDLRQEGRHLDGGVRSDMATGNFAAPGGNAYVEDDVGVPL